MSGLTIAAPQGAHFDFEEVKTARGTESLGEVPVLVWDSLDAAVAQYGDDGVVNVLDGTSLRVSFQSIARRYRIAKKSDDEIAKAQIDFKPGKRAAGVSTPVSRMRNAAVKVATKIGDEGADAIAELLKAVTEGKIKLEDVLALASTATQ